MRNVVAIIRRSTASSLLLFLCFFLWASSFFVTYRRVVGDSMKPAFSTGSILVCTKTADVEKLRYGDCVVAHIPYSGEDLTVTKRIVGLPGDRIQIREGLLYRNGEAVPDGLPMIENAGIAENPVLLAPGHCFLLGDNRNHSRDSREFGSVPVCFITNRILFHLF